MIDSHAHITSKTLLEEVESLLLRAQEIGVKHIVNICTDPASLTAGLKLKERFSSISNAAATTPQDAETEEDHFFPLVEEACQKKLLAAVGETGLDYHYSPHTKHTQKRFFSRYISLAKEHKLPLVIHCRDAFEDFFSIVDKEYQNGGKWGPLALHCFTGTLEEALEVLKRGFYLSLSGIVTFKNSEELRKVAAIVPLAQLLVESDSPYLAPVPKRGKTNEPSFLPYTCRVIAEAKGIDPSTVAAACASNAQKLFALSDEK